MEERKIEFRDKSQRVGRGKRRYATIKIERKKEEKKETKKKQTNKQNRKKGANKQTNKQGNLNEAQEG